MSAHFYPPAGGSGGGSPYWGDAVATFAALPVTGLLGEVRLVLDADELYEWNGTAWQKIVSNATVLGPASATDNSLPRFDGTTGKLIQGSGVIVDDTNNITGIVNFTATGTTTLNTALSGPIRATSGVIGTGNTNLASEVTGILPIANGGTNSNVALANDRAIVSNTGSIVEHPTTTATEIGYLTGVTSGIQAQLDAKADLAGTANKLAIYSNTGELQSSSPLGVDPVYGGFGCTNNLVVGDSESGATHFLRSNIEADESAPNTSRTHMRSEAYIDIGNTGFNIGTASNCLTLNSWYMEHAGTSDAGSFDFLNMSSSIGNGTDPINVRGFGFAYGFSTINANVTLTGPIQGFGFQPSVNASAVLDSNAYIIGFYDFATINCVLGNGYTSASYGPIIEEIPNNQNYTGLNINPTINNLSGNGSMVGVNIGSTLPTMNPNSYWQGVNVNPTISSARYAAGFQCSMDNVTPYAGVQSTLTIQDLTFTWVQAGDNNSYTIEYTSGGTAGSEVVTISGQNISVQIDSGVSTATQIKAALDAVSGFVAAVTTTISGVGSNPQTAVAATNFTGGENPGNIYAAFFDGKVGITGALEFNGDFQCQKFDAFRTYALINNGGQPTSGHSLITAQTVAASATVANADTLGVNTAALINIGANATVTTSFLGVSALGLPAVLTMGSGATIDRVSGAIFALSLDVSAGGGTVDTVSLCRSIAVPNGVTTVNRLYGYEFALPFGDPGTKSWGLYSAPAVPNWLAGSLKIGGTALTDDEPENSSVGLELKSTTKAFLNARMTTVQRDALTGLDGMQIYNTTENRLETRQNGSWVPAGGVSMSPSSISAVAVNTTMVDRVLYLVDSSGGPITMTLPAPTTNAYIVVKDTGNATTNNISVAPNGAEDVDGSNSSYMINADYASNVFVSDGTDWFVI